MHCATWQASPEEGDVPVEASSVDPARQGLLKDDVLHAVPDSP
jgi:hypothetical protein